MKNSLKPPRLFYLMTFWFDELVTLLINNLSANAQQVRCVRSGTENNIERSQESVSNGFKNSRTK